MGFLVGFRILGLACKSHNRRFHVQSFHAQIRIVVAFEEQVDFVHDLGVFVADFLDGKGTNCVELAFAVGYSCPLSAWIMRRDWIVSKQFQFSTKAGSNWSPKMVISEEELEFVLFHLTKSSQKLVKVKGQG